MMSLADIAASLQPARDADAATDFAQAAPPAVLGGLVYRPTLYRRNAVAWAAVRHWRADAKTRDLTRFKLCKLGLDLAIIGAAADEIADLARLLLGPGASSWSTTSIACGHSRRPDCFGKRLGQAVAQRLKTAFLEVFQDRFVRGASHPKEFRKLPPLIWHEKPTGPLLIVDDVATSGWHIEEALGRVRDLGLPALGLVWI